MMKSTQRNRHVRLAAAALCLAAGMAQGASLKYPEEKIPVLNVPRMASPPTVDGVIEPGEWRDAVRVMGVVATHGLGYKDRPVAFHVAWDENHLYLAAVSDILPGHRLYRSRRERFTTGVVYDDSYEFGIFLHDRNRLEGEVSSFLKMVLNAMGAGEYMKIYPSIGQNMYNWQPDPQLANRVYEEDGREWWAMEMALDLEDLQLSEPQQAGDRLDMLLAADLKNPKWQWLDFPSASGHLEHYGFTRMTLTDAQPFVQIEALEGLHDEKLDFRSTLTNPGPKPVTVEAALDITYNPPESAGEEPRRVVDAKRSLTIPAGETVRFDVAETFPGLVYKKTKWGRAENVSELRIRVADTDDAARPPVYSYVCQFAASDKSYLQAVPRTTAFDASIRFNPARNILEVIGDTLDAQIPDGTEPAALGYTVTRDGETVAGGRKTLLVNLKYEGFVELPGLEPGAYGVKLALLDADGRELVAKDDLGFEKKDEARVFAAWWNNNIGDTRKVLKPFTAIEVDGDRAAVTRRTYTLDALGLPRAIEANGGPVLTAPARIVVTVGGKEHVVPAAGTVAYTSREDWRTEFTGGPVEAAGVRFTVSGWMEQDGLVNLDVTYAATGEPVAVEDLRVEWPVDGTDGSWLHCIGGVGGNYAPRTIDKVPDGEGEVWDCLTDIGKAGSQMVAGNWQNNLWVGNDRRGLCWFGDHDRGWVPTETTPAHSLFREGDAVVIRNHIIRRPDGAGPFTLDAPRTINLQYNATPFRHLASGFRLTQVSACNGFFVEGKNGSVGYKWDVDEQEKYFTVLSMPSKDTSKWPWYLEQYKAVADRQLRDSIPYSIRDRLRPWHCNQIALRGYANKTREPGLYDYFRADWTTPFGGESLNKTYRDYMMYLMDMHVREGGLTHYYFDISFTRSTPALSAGFGYRLPNGKVQPTSMDGTLRAWYKRTWALMQEHDLYPGAVSGHATHSMPLRAMPWCDSQLDAEYPIRDACTVYPIDAMIAMSVPHTFGVNIVHHGHMDYRWASMFDSSKGASAFPFNAPAFRHFGIAADDVEFLGFWRNGEVVKPDDPGLLVSAWKRPGKVVLQLFNYGLDPEGGEQTRSGRMTLDLQALGVPAGARPGQLRIRELALRDGRVSSRSSLFDWYEELPLEPRWKNDREPRVRPPSNPTLGADGVVDGVEVFYHDTRFLEITWDDAPVSADRVAAAVGPANAEEALCWGLSRATAADPLVKTSTGGVALKAWKQPGTAMILVTGAADRKADVTLDADLAGLGVKVERPFVAYTQCLGGDLDAHSGRVTVKGLGPAEQRLVFIDTFGPAAAP